MNEYAVTVHEVYTYVVRVKADNEADARLKAEDKIEEGCDEQSNLSYSTTLDPEEWGVQKLIDG